LYVQVQLEPVQSACQVLPRASWHIVVVVETLPAPALPVPEHDAGPVGLGMAGHTLSSTHALGGGAEEEEPASLRHAFAACAWASHPGKTVPMDVQTGCTDSVQLRRAMTAEVQGAVIAVSASQFEAQAGSEVDERHPAAANFEQKVEQEAATRAGEQLVSHSVREPASPPEPVVAPPQARVDARAQAKKVREQR
jgi:hypothetical protein